MNRRPRQLRGQALVRPPLEDQQLRSEFADDEDMRELILEFVLELPARTATMRGLAVDNDRESLRAVAHQLKGAGGGYGYPAITQAAARLESAIRAGTSDSELLERLESLIEYCEAAVTELAPDPARVAYS